MLSLAHMQYVPQNLRLYRELAAVLMEAGDRQGLITACQRFGDARTGGWSAHALWVGARVGGQAGRRVTLSALEGVVEWRAG